MKLSKEALAVKVQLQEFSQNRRMISNLLAEKKELLEICDLLKRGDGVMTDGGEKHSRQEKLVFRLEAINARISELLLSASNTESILLSAMGTLSPTEYNMIWERYAKGKSIARLCREFYYSEQGILKRYNRLFNKLIPLVVKQDKFEEELQNIEMGL